MGFEDLPGVFLGCDGVGMMVMYIWWFPEMGVPLVIIHLEIDFPV